MIRNYFKTILGGFKKDKSYTLTSIFGLTLAFTAVLILVIFIQFERSFDRHFTASEQIYLIYLNQKNDTVSSDSREYLVNTGLSPALKNNVPGIEYVSMFQNYTADLSGNEHLPMTKKILSVDSSFFDIFDFSFIAGDPARALNVEESMVLTENAAMDFFNSTDVIGKTLNLSYRPGLADTYTITGVIENLPSNTSFATDVILNNGYSKSAFSWDAKSSNKALQFVRIEPGLATSEIQSRLAAFQKYQGNLREVSVGLMPLQDLHLSGISDLQGVFDMRDIRYLYIFGGVALLILLIASINYINLSLARSLQRIKEVAVRKSIGASPKDVFLQFIGESSFYFVVSLPLAFLIAHWLTPVFFDIFEIAMPSGYLFNPAVLGLVLATAFLTSLIAGAYPAFFLARQKPSHIFVKQNSSLNVNFGLRKILIVVQFGIAIFLIAVTLGMYRQANLLQSSNLGFDSEHLIALPNTSFREHYAAFKNDILSHKDILGLTTASSEVGGQLQRHSSDSVGKVAIQTIVGDFDFAETLGLKISRGRNFLATSDFERNFDVFFTQMEVENGADEKTIAELTRRRPILVTENLIARYNLEDPLGTVFKDQQGRSYGTIVGVTEDFDFGPQRDQSSVKVIYGDYSSFFGGYGYIRVSASGIPQSLQHIADTWKKFAPGQAFSYHFVDEKIQKFYEQESRLVALFRIFSLLGIGLSALGLFSLVSLMIKHRTKEIGIRKVMGASVAHISILFTRNFLILVICAGAISIPLSWWALHLWLEDYAIRIQLEWTIFTLSALVGLVIAALTVNLQALRAATANPVDSLRDE